MLLVVGHLQLARVGQNNHGVVKTGRHVVNHHVVEHAGLVIFLFYIEVVAAYLVVEYPLGNIELGRLLPHRVEQGPHLHLRLGQYVVLEKEGTDGHKDKEDNQRPHDLQQRDTGRLDGQQLQPLAQIAEGHQRSQQDGQRQGHGHHGHGSIEKQFGQNRHFETLPYHLIDVPPQKLHEYDEEADEECHQKQG